MSDRGRHYERAFEDYLRRRRVPYVCVDDARQALLPEGASLGAPEDGALRRRALKSFDFVVYGEGGNLLIDVKGRRVAPRARGVGRLESWVTLDDVESLGCWERLFGAGYVGVFVFVYWCDGQPPDGLFQEVFTYRERWYAVRSVTLGAYASEMRTRSARWRTVHLPTREFERLSQPFCPPAGGFGEGPETALHPLGAVVSSGRHERHTSS
ncbi:MAG: HYExAFE family protein [Phycisphaerales bacterium]